MGKEFFSYLKCRECGRQYPKKAVHVCEFDFGPLEADYNYELIKHSISRKLIESRPHSMWRYRELLPIDGEPTVGLNTGFTPLVKADRLAKALGVRELYVKNDAFNYPTLSFKDRVVSVALSRAKELGFKIVACASTGNLANSVAAHAAGAGLKSYVLIPADLEQSKVLNSLVYGTNVIGIHGAYDQVNRLCSEIAGKYGWGFVNVNLRPYYAEGSKTHGLRDRRAARLAPAAAHRRADGQRLAAHQDRQGLPGSDQGRPHRRAALHDPRRAGGGLQSRSPPRSRPGPISSSPVPKPKTIAKSLAIGTPADGYYAVQRDPATRGGSCEDATDEEIIEGIRLLAETEGIFAETAGGVTVACAKKLIASGKIPANESVVLCITGHGLKTAEARRAASARAPPHQPQPARIRGAHRQRRAVHAAA